MTEDPLVIAGLAAVDGLHSLTVREHERENYQDGPGHTDYSRSHVIGEAGREREIRRPGIGRSHTHESGQEGENSKHFLHCIILFLVLFFCTFTGARNLWFPVTMTRTPETGNLILAVQ